MLAQISPVILDVGVNIEDYIVLAGLLLGDVVIVAIAAMVAFHLIRKGWRYLVAVDGAWADLTWDADTRAAWERDRESERIYNENRAREQAEREAAYQVKFEREQQYRQRQAAYREWKRKQLGLKPNNQRRRRRRAG